ncbi:AbrB family transcriptional regulator [Oryzicola mucosus]|uniref:AbrB family transcriptional regulator n=1 Tax=Oryzicola mucosus TaxID=2767425 RepID=A0A8J6PUM0_9HYPH|nr:AbrB family transcriptional regulator [Oryzicola mucosus]MBD0414488.1 AbrB family transcriptional regulator [Oryzicola mucosus]
MSPVVPSPSRLGTLHPFLQWLILLALSAVITAVLELVHLPATLLLGPMFAGIVAGVQGATIRLPRTLFLSGQAIVGCLIAMSISPEIFPTLVSEWPIFAGAAVSTILASSFLGWSISRLKILPGTTAVWGSAPGASSAMVFMAESFGADARLVAFMQYLRVIMVSAAAALIARLWVDTSTVEPVAIDWFPAIEPLPLATTFLIAAGGATLGRLLRLPSPFFLGAMIVGVVLHLGFSVPLQLPHWLLAISYPLIGWSIGLNFTAAILRHAARALPQVVGSILALMAFCGGIAWFLTHSLGIDPLTAYLATSPGGMDSVAIIAAASHSVDLSFIMALQMMRFLCVLLFGPWLARFVARFVA